jgi:Cellulase (glycosyl hydrolase family 5)
VDGLTRRAFVQRAGLAAGLAGAAAWSSCGSEGDEESGGLRKCVAMGSINHGGDLEDLLAHDNLDKVLELRARWVRIWIRWDKAQVFPPSEVPWADLDKPANDRPDCATGCGYRYIRAIDDQIERARDAGLNVILTTWHFPRWANGTEGVPADFAREDRGFARTPVERLRPLEFRVPAGQLGRSGHYGRWLDWLVTRYREYGRHLVLEIMNEPNHQLWPQQGPSRTGDPYGEGELVIDGYIAEMMGTAREVSASHGHRVHVAAPGLSDRIGANTRVFTNLETMVPTTLGRLGRRGFPSTPSFIWTHHNYIDVERELTSPSRTELCRRELRGRWRGRGGPGDPRIWITEGGARLGSGEAVDLEAQARLVRQAWARMSATPWIELFANYPMYENPVADSGLRRALAAGGGPRPVWNVFRDFPSRA